MRMRHVPSIAAAVALAVAGVGGIAGPAQAATAKPGIVVDYAYHTVKVKPKTFRPYKDVYFSNLRWTSLGSTTGYATGTENVNTCVPDCAHANYKHFRVKLKFSTIKRSDGRRVFSQVRVTEIKSKRTRILNLPVCTRSGCDPRR